MSAGIFQSMEQRNIYVFTELICAFWQMQKIFSQGEACGQQRVEANISNLDEKILLSVLLPDLSIPFFYVNIGDFFI